MKASQEQSVRKEEVEGSEALGIVKGDDGKEAQCITEGDDEIDGMEVQTLVQGDDEVDGIEEPQSYELVS